MRKLITVWMIGAVVLLLISVYFKREATNFHGIAETREIIINNENPVVIRHIGIVPGQALKKGDFLVELFRPELEKKIVDIAHEIDRLRAQKTTDSGYVKSQISQLRAQRAAKVNEINSQIEELQNRMKVNKELTSELKSIKEESNAHSQGQSIIELRIENLRKELQLSLDEIDLRIQQLQREALNPISVQVQNLEEELKMMNSESEKLHITSPIDGVIGSVDFKEGETVSPFTPIITLHTKSPSYIKGYINENVYNRISTGMKVKVVSLADHNKTIDGVVVGVGSRIVECPQRLWKRPDIQVWGREVQIKITDDNDLLLGEKVLVEIFQNSR
jgi:multidrug resistance efflux pump